MNNEYISKIVEKQCIAMDFLHIRNQSDYWGAIVLIILLLATFGIWWWVATDSFADVATEGSWLEKLKWIVTGGFILIGLFILYSMYSTQQYFMKYGLTSC